MKYVDANSPRILGINDQIYHLAFGGDLWLDVNGEQPLSDSRILYQRLVVGDDMRGGVCRNGVLG